MSHVLYVVHGGNGEDVGLVMGEVGVSLDFGSHLLQCGTLFQLHVYHAAVDALTQWDGDGESLFHALLAAHAYGVAHAHAGTEVGVGQSLGGQALHEDTYDGVRTRIPTCGDDAHLARLLAVFHLLGAVVEDAGVDVEAVHGVDAEGNDLLRILRTAAGRSGEDGNVHVLELGDVVHHLIVGKLCRLVLGTLATYDTCNLEVGSCLECLY